MPLPRELLEAKIAELRIIDDTFARVFFDDDPECVETVLRIILDKPDLKVVSQLALTQTQRLVHNYGGREVILDVYAEDKSGKRYNIELQRDDRGATLRRARLHLSLMDARALEKGEDPDNLPETYIVFLTERDALNKGVTMWKAPRTFWYADAGGEETPHAPADDGSHIIFVNAERAQDDPTAVGALMRDVMRKSAETMETPALKKRMNEIKNSREGKKKMCKVMEELIKEEKRLDVQNMLKMGLDKAFIMKALRLSEEQFEELSTPLAS